MKESGPCDFENLLIFDGVIFKSLKQPKHLFKKEWTRVGLDDSYYSYL